MRFLIFVSIGMLLSLIPIEGILPRYGVTDPTTIFLLKTLFIVIVAWPLSYLFSRGNVAHRHESRPPLEDVSASLARDIITKDSRYSQEIRKLIADELQKNTVVVKWNPTIHDICIIPSSPQPNDTTISIIERFCTEHARLLERYGIYT
jgi:hypothetical protein